MKVLLTLPVKVGFDGMTKQVLSYGKYMNREDLEIDLLSCRGYDEDMKYLVEAANFNHVYRMEYRDTNQIKYFFDLVRLIKKRRYDVIHANGQSATLAVEMLAGVFGGCKLRVAHSHNSKCLHKRVHQLLYPLFGLTHNDSIACSHEAGYWLFHGESYWILPNGIDVDLFAFSNKKRYQFRSELGLAENEVAVGHIGAFEPWKNHLFLLDVFKQLKSYKNIRLFLWGIDGTAKNDVIAKIREYGLEDTVTYKGTTDHISDYLNAMDLMVLPSWYEGFPVTAVEWQANGLPCILSDSISHEVDITGLISFLSIENIDAWVNYIIEFEADSGKRESKNWGKVLREKGFDIHQNANDLKLHYSEMLNNN